MLVNRNRVDTHGVELAGRYSTSDAWAFDASVTNVKSRIASTGGELRNRPEWRGGVGRALDAVGGVAAVGLGHLRGRIVRLVDSHGGRELEAYTRIDVSAAWQVSEKFQTYLAVDNLTDVKYEQFVGFESRGFMPRAGVKFSF